MAPSTLIAIEYLRTPDQSFVGLKDYPFKPNYAQVHPGNLRMHYVDEGPKSGKVVLLLHGEPSWSYLYRHIIQGLVKHGYRVVAPDLIGFGKSDKPIKREDYTYSRHVEWLEHLLLNTLDLKQITLFCQDWGGCLGLRILAAHPDRFASVVVANTFLPTGEGSTPGFLRWLKFSQSSDSLDVPFLLSVSVVHPMSEETKHAYGAPFPDARYQAGVLQFPTLVPITNNADAEINRKAWEVLAKFNKPFLLAFSDSDPVTGGLDQKFKEVVPGTRGQPHVTIEQAGHFLQEDAPDQIVHIIHNLISNNSKL